MRHTGETLLFLIDPRLPDRDQAAGVSCGNSKKGYHEWVGSMDLNSLYPSVFRALNMAPETIVGQLRLDYTEETINNACVQKRNHLVMPNGMASLVLMSLNL